MSTLDFRFFDDEADVKGSAFVILEAEKGKRLLQKTVIKRDVFRYIEGIIWYQHREYGNNKESKIRAIDWIRINQGFEEAIEKLSLCENEQELISILHLPSHLDSTHLKQLHSQLPAFIQFIKDMILWMQKNTPRKSHIMIIKQS